MCVRVCVDVPVCVCVLVSIGFAEHTDIHTIYTSAVFGMSVVRTCVCGACVQRVCVQEHVQPTVMRAVAYA